MNKWESIFPIGSVVYYIDKHGNMDWHVTWGLVDEHYVDALSIKTVRFKDVRLINGIPYNDFEPDKRRQKLPKGWTYDTEMYELTINYDGTPLEYFSLANPKDCLKAYNDGWYIDTKDYDFSHIEVDINKEGWKLVKRHYPYNPIPPAYISRPYCECFANYDDAVYYKEAHDAEILRQCELTDYEWSLEQIDHILDKAVGLHYIIEDGANSIRKQLLEEDVENIEVRLANGGIQWKLWKNKKWMTITP